MRLSSFPGTGNSQQDKSHPARLASFSVNALPITSILSLTAFKKARVVATNLRVTYRLQFRKSTKYVRFCLTQKRDYATRIVQNFFTWNFFLRTKFQYNMR